MDNPRWSHPKVLIIVTMAMTLPNKVTFIDSMIQAYILRIAIKSTIPSLFSQLSYVVNYTMLTNGKTWFHRWVCILAPYLLALLISPDTFSLMCCWISPRISRKMYLSACAGAWCMRHTQYGEFSNDEAIFSPRRGWHCPTCKTVMQNS